jgi:hypothetical protein
VPNYCGENKLARLSLRFFKVLTLTFWVGSLARPADKRASLLRLRGFLLKKTFGNLVVKVVKKYMK